MSGRDERGDAGASVGVGAGALSGGGSCAIHNYYYYYTGRGLTDANGGCRAMHE